MVAASKGCFDVGVTSKRALRMFLSLGATASALSCGPSFQAIYEGNSHFEHCYALEERQQTPVGEKADCWQDWSERYTYGQTRDRIHYATARYVALSQTVPTDEAMMMAAPGMTPRQSTITAPMPTNAFAPPPKVLEDYDASTGKPARPSEVSVMVGAGAPSRGAGAGAPIVDAGPPLPAADCTDGCARRFRECKEGCSGPSDAGAAARAATCAACDKTYRGCVRDCVK